MEPEQPRTARKARICWADVHAYASRFDEYRIIQAVQADARGQRVPLGDRQAGSLVAAAAMQRFGPLALGDVLVGDWTIVSLRREHGSVLIGLGASTAPAPGVLWFRASGPDSREPDGPFQAAPLRLSYQRTAIRFGEIERVGRALRDRLLAAWHAERGAWEQWLGVSGASPPHGCEPASVRRLPDADALEVRADGKAYLRITDQCQERCSFCFFYDTPNVDNLVRHHDVAELVAALDPETIQQVVLTGGEPTLDPRLPHYVATLAARGFRSIILQTNGIKLGEPGILETLLPFRERLGIGFALHSATERTNDALTHGPPGAFPRKLHAIRSALALGFRCKVTLVLSRTNLPELVAFMETCSELLGGSDAFVGLSLPAIEGRMRLFLDSYPRLSELAVALPPALRRARELDLLVAFCHQCQVPPCIIPDDAQHLESLWFTERPAMWDHDRAYGARCHGCAIRAHCSGVWSRYAEHFGTGELVPLGAEDVDLSPRAAERP